MKYPTTLFGAASCCISQVAAFPAAAIEFAAKAELDERAQASIEGAVAKFGRTHSFPGSNLEYHGQLEDQLLLSLVHSDSWGRHKVSRPHITSTKQILLQPDQIFTNKGILTQEALKSFFAITGDSGNFTWNEGQERIPDNWYKRSIGDEYDTLFLVADLLQAALEYPQFLDVGANTGSVDTFTGVDLQNLTRGLYNPRALVQGDNTICFAAQALQQAGPDLLKGLVVDVVSALGLLNSTVGDLLKEVTCLDTTAFDFGQVEQYPGAKGAS
ncbi:hypothetical protein G7Y89_g11029 [Cudoniella acicularis]|uniref:Heme haloperoxidase family profile domain-containing protein n=1 Tax=Cudoniella acicularis TaxID=354080 RepID=A0A8H4VYF4_9HELO|nr:hypothetical protein G7Y89_g11029 [Cudoniella acicularis]